MNLRVPALIALVVVLGATIVWNRSGAQGVMGGASPGVSQVVVDSLAGQISDLQTQIATKANASAMPQPANSAPPASDGASAIGAVTARYALEDHTHVSMVRSCRTQVAGGAGIATCLYVDKNGAAAPFASGTEVHCSADAEVASGASVPLSTNVVASPSISQAQAKVFGMAIVSVVGINVLGGLSVAPNGTWVEFICRPKPAP